MLASLISINCDSVNSNFIPRSAMLTTNAWGILTQRHHFVVLEKVALQHKIVLKLENVENAK